MKRYGGNLNTYYWVKEVNWKHYILYIPTMWHSGIKSSEVGVETEHRGLVWMVLEARGPAQPLLPSLAPDLCPVCAWHSRFLLPDCLPSSPCGHTRTSGQLPHHVEGASQETQRHRDLITLHTGFHGTLSYLWASRSWLTQAPGTKSSPQCFWRCWVMLVQGGYTHFLHLGLAFALRFSRPWC